MKKEEVIKLLKEHNRTWEEFERWMTGQTIGGTPENPDYYECDIERFIENYLTNLIQ